MAAKTTGGDYCLQPLADAATETIAAAKLVKGFNIAGEKEVEVDAQYFDAQVAQNSDDIKRANNFAKYTAEVKGLEDGKDELDKTFAEKKVQRSQALEQLGQQDGLINGTNRKIEALKNEKKDRAALKAMVNEAESPKKVQQKLEGQLEDKRTEMEEMGRYGQDAHHLAVDIEQIQKHLGWLSKGEKEYGQEKFDGIDEQIKNREGLQQKVNSFNSNIILRAQSPEASTAIP